MTLLTRHEMIESSLREERDAAREQVRGLRDLLEDTASLLTDFASGYLSPDGTAVVETRGSLGRQLAALWPKLKAALKGEEEAK